VVVVCSTSSTEWSSEVLVGAGVCSTSIDGRQHRVSARSFQNQNTCITKVKLPPRVPLWTQFCKPSQCSLA
jgi:hypothetical protein